MKIEWDQNENFTKNLLRIVTKLVGLDLKTLLYPVLLIYWAIIIRTFFTVELKTTKTNKIRFSPHQIAFHVKHPKNSFILVEHLGQRSVKLFPGSMIKELDACGLALDPLCLTLDACCLWLSELGA